MSWNMQFLTSVMDNVQSILQSIGSPIILGVFGFALLSLFLSFRK